jgi:hypothetical protein
VAPIEGLDELAGVIGATERDPDPVRASAADFILEGLHALKKISRTDEGRLFATPPARTDEQRRVIERLMDEDEDEDTPRGKKKYYN